jgi:hypothetical protein
MYAFVKLERESHLWPIARAVQLKVPISREGWKDEKQSYNTTREVT